MRYSGAKSSKEGFFGNRIALWIQRPNRLGIHNQAFDLTTYCHEETHHGYRKESRFASQGCRTLTRSRTRRAHPIETGIGAAVGGAATGLAAGAVAGPVTAAVGAAVGAVAGGYAGKSVGEMIDPTTEDTWLRDNFESRPYVQKGETFDTYHPAYHYGGLPESRCGDADFESMEEDLESDWQQDAGPNPMPWTCARGAVKDSYDRCVQLRKERQRRG